MTRIGVLHVIESLDAGGAERMAVQIANLTPRERYRTHVCTTKSGGALESMLADDVRWLRLECKGGFDSLRAWRSLRSYIRRHQIQILHAHGWSLFAARLAACGATVPKLVWHDHFGRQEQEQRSRWLYGCAARRADAVVAVTASLAAWSRKQLRVPAHRVWHIPNFVHRTGAEAEPADVPGTAGARIVYVANFRAQKDHVTLIRALTHVIGKVPEAHLLLVGTGRDSGYRQLVIQEIDKQGVSSHVSRLGERLDVPSILRASDVGVLSSSSEGLPLALIEYGLAALPVVATDVGQCREILDHGRAGILVAPSAPESLAGALSRLLQSREERSTFGERLHKRVQELYSPAAVLPQICNMYESILTDSGQKR